MLNQWRTYTATLILALMLLVGLLLVTMVGHDGALSSAYVAYCSSVVALGGILGAKSGIEHFVKKAKKNEQE